MIIIITIVATALATYFILRAYQRKTAQVSPIEQRALRQTAALRKHFLGDVNPLIEEQFMLLMAAMFAHGQIEQGLQAGEFDGTSSEQQDTFIEKSLITALGAHGYDPSFLRLKLARYVFELYRNFYLTYLKFAPSPEESGQTAVSSISTIAAAFLKQQFIETGKSDICDFLKANLHSVRTPSSNIPTPLPPPTATERTPPRAQSPDDHKKSNSPKILAFKTNTFAFEYACKYLQNRIVANEGVVGIILGFCKDGEPCVKVANGDDHSVPSGTFEFLFENCDVRNTCFSTKVINSVPKLETNDLVMFVPTIVAPGGQLLTGAVVAKLSRTLDVEKGFSVLDK